MANGELAASVGMDTVAGSSDIRNGYDEDNKSRDYIAKHLLTGTHDADQITSGILPVRHGGTGRSNIFGAQFSGAIDPDVNAIMTVSSASVVRRATGKLAPQYLGFNLWGGVAEDVDFDENGQASIEHDLGWTPLVAMFIHDGDYNTSSVNFTISNITASVFGIHGRSLAGNVPFQGELEQVRWLAWGAV